MVDNSLWLTKQQGLLRLQELLEYNSQVDKIPYSYITQNINGLK